MVSRVPGGGGFEATGGEGFDILAEFGAGDDSGDVVEVDVDEFYHRVEQVWVGEFDFGDEVGAAEEVLVEDDVAVSDAETELVGVDVIVFDGDGEGGVEAGDAVGVVVEVAIGGELESRPALVDMVLDGYEEAGVEVGGEE